MQLKTSSQWLIKELNLSNHMSTRFKYTNKINSKKENKLKKLNNEVIVQL